MFFRFDRQFKLLRVEDTYATLTDVDLNGNMTFEFRYGVSQLDVVQRDALTVNVDVISRSVESPPLLGDSQLGRVNTRALIKNVLRQSQDMKSAIRKRDKFIVARRRSDITAKINNEIVPQLRMGTPKNMIPFFRKPKLQLRSAQEIKQQNEEKPLLQRVAHHDIMDVQTEVSESTVTPTRRIMFDMIVRQGIDPSNVTRMNHRSVSSRASFAGTLRPSRYPERSFDPGARLLNHHLFLNALDASKRTSDELTDNVQIHVVDTDVDDSIEVPVTVVIPFDRRFVDGEETSHFLVKFELIDGTTGGRVDQVIKPLDVARHLQLYYTPREPPKVSVANSTMSSYARLDITQVDTGATAVNIFRKKIGRSTVMIDDYALIGTYKLTTKERVLSVQVDRGLESSFIYRVVPVGEYGNSGFEYTNVIVNPARYMPLKSISLVAEIVDTGIKVTVGKIPTSTVAVEIRRRNKTTHETDCTNVGGITLIDAATREADNFSVIDATVLTGRIYEYTLRLVHRSGGSNEAGHALVEYVRPTPGKVDTKVTDLQVTHEIDGPNVTFSFETTVVDTDVDVIKVLLQRADIKEYFEDNLKDERDLFKDLLAHNVQRVNLTTGQREDFGIITADNFDDRDKRKNNSVMQLQYGHKYRYEVYPLLRAPETLFETFEKEKVDEVTKKSYKFKPHKFLHPQALTQGVIVTPAGLRTRFSKTAMAHGAIGVVETVDVSFDEKTASIMNPTAVRFDNELNVVTWKVTGTVSQVDHFLVMKDVHGVRTMLGRVHCEFEFGNAQFLHKTSDLDEGEFQYVIVPIFNDYNKGDEAFSNAVIV